jgi:hypothetical protein
LAIIQNKEKISSEIERKRSFTPILGGMFLHYFLEKKYRSKEK